MPHHMVIKQPETDRQRLQKQAQYPIDLRLFPMLINQTHHCLQRHQCKKRCNGCFDLQEKFHHLPLLLLGEQILNSQIHSGLLQVNLPSYLCQSLFRRHLYPKLEPLLQKKLPPLLSQMSSLSFGSSHSRFHPAIN